MVLKYDIIHHYFMSDRYHVLFERIHKDTPSRDRPNYEWLCEQDSRVESLVDVGLRGNNRNTFVVRKWK